MIKVVGVFLLILFLLFAVWVFLRMLAEARYISKRERRAKRRKRTTVNEIKK